MRALVTGASGFLGGAVASLLVREGASVAVLARSSSVLGHLTGLPVEVRYGALTDQEALRAAVQGCTHVFHCAACSTDWAPLHRYVDANVTGTRNLFEAATTVAGLQRLVHVSTTDVYGYPARTGDERLPLVETALPYNRTKVQGEREVWAAAERGLPVSVVRPATIYGPRGKDFTLEMATLLRQRLMATIDGGRATGGFTYVDNVAEAMLAVATSEHSIGQAYNIADGTGASWKRYLSLFADALGVKPPWIDLSFAMAMRLAAMLETPHRWGLPGKPLLTRHAVQLLGRDQEFCSAKARADFGFAPRVGLEEGIARSVRWLATTGKP